MQAKYEDLRSQMKTGDLISFSGKGRVSNIIKGYTNSDISHVGIVYANEGRVKIMESTSLNDIADIDTGEFVKGVQKQYLSERLKGYDGQCYWQPLNVKIKDKYKDAMINWLSDAHGKRTPYDTIQAIGAGADIFDKIPGFENEEDFSSLFCSELVCKALQVADVVTSVINPSEQTPADVIGYRCFDKRIEIIS